MPEGLQMPKEISKWLAQRGVKTELGASDHEYTKDG
jgi:hypothetical protein